MICEHLFEASQCAECRYQEGRNDGLEEAAVLCDMYVKSISEQESNDNIWMDGKRSMAEMLSECVRALKEKP